ncbi:Methionine synthase [Tepidanaerobacter acetatoxydans Re1]|uniref:Methionine synthase n=1 Tax=Tepidanaerobacter acetatoxydans (strain DSM 21804 / JCM 16047 / Re1) TaxID=1209989 RepID=F4LV47_TEPAE|nr:homocysteine S-methyltransferase family protein [Tepidanaerobacter acetatoxydans]AEE92694.1 Methionine synthase [Tepidanaerobacter acetatoxydans Re1]CCP27670.1 Methionine synthase [Tepidanaerobacter acetatoxydans Re1]
MSKRIDFSNFIVFDGAMGTMLQTHGLKAGELPESYNILHPEIIEKIHGEYLDAGADVITTNTFGANRIKLSKYGYDIGEIVKSGVKIALKAAGKRLVALDIGPIGQLMKPYGTLSFSEAYELFREQVIAGADAGADLILIETMSDIYEMKAAILAAKENCNLPVVATMTFQQDKRTLTGTDPLTMVNVICGLGVNALGINCSLGPKEILPLIEEVLSCSKIPVIAQPNAGMPKIIDGKTVFNVEPDEFARYAKIMAEKGVTILGGCCGTNPEHIRALRHVLAGLEPIKRKVEPITAASSFSKTVIIGEGITVIGEKLNPTGRKHLKEALKSNDMEYVLRQALAQQDAGAHILNVNAGLPEIDEKAVMINIIRELQSTVSVPLQIDSTDSDVIEAAVRIYNGRPIINSVNGKLKVMEEIFPIAKKYGACVVGLTLDENGIPSKAKDRFKIAENIVKTASKYGIAKEDLIIDCLVIAASAQQDEVREIIKATRLVKERLGVKTILGVSNISFGLPNRTLLNRTFLALALEAGLDAPIIDPADEEVMGTINAFNVLWGYDKYANNYIAAYAPKDKKPAVKAFSATDVADIEDIIINGLKEEAAPKVRAMLKAMSPTQIIDEHLVPSLDIVGRKYEAGEIFLPQLIQSAETAKRAFEAIKHHIIETNGGKAEFSKGKIILATVRGDIHDIGKNIVKILLENYGFEVIDLGKDVPEDEIIQRIKQDNVSLVGLSALMTTTAQNMANTIKAIRKAGLGCKIMVGGAVVNAEFAKSIGADYYGRDAQESVRIAQEFFSPS